MKLLVVALLSMSLHAQTVTLTGPSTASPGQTVSLSLGVTGSTGANLNGLGWATAPAAVWTAGPDATGATKTIWCGATCFLVGVTAAGIVSNTPLTDGILATGSFQVPASQALGALPIALSGLIGVNGGGGTVAITPGAAYTLTIAAPNLCDVNGDGVVNGKDALLVLQSVPGASNVSPLPACPISAGCTLQAVEIIIHATATALGGDGASCTLGH